MQICTSLQTDNHASTPPLSFLQAGCPFCHPTNSVKALKAKIAVLCVEQYFAGWCPFDSLIELYCWTIITPVCCCSMASECCCCSCLGVHSTALQCTQTVSWLLSEAGMPRWNSMTPSIRLAKRYDISALCCIVSVMCALSNAHSCNYYHYTCLTASFPELPGWAGTRKVKPV